MALFKTKKREARKSMHQPGWITLDGGFIYYFYPSGAIDDLPAAVAVAVQGFEDLHVSGAEDGSGDALGLADRPGRYGHGVRRG